MSNILIDLLPSKVKIDGTEYNINSNFRTSVLFSLLMEDEELTEKEKINQALELYYPIIPHNKIEAVEKIKWFYSCGKDNDTKPAGKKGNSEKILDYEEDAKYIYSAFLSQYRIDLQDIEYLHWWKFKALLDSLGENNKLLEIMKYRSIDISKIEDKEQRRFYKDMKKIYSLNKHNKEDEQIINDWNKLLKQS